MSRYDPTDPDQVAQRQADAARAKQQVEADWEFLLRAPQGRRVLVALLTQSGFLHSSYVQGDALATAYGEGKREMGARIYSATTSVRQGALLPALLAEVMSKPNVGNRRASPDPDADTG